MNTDDLEGHTPGPWTIVWWEGTWYVDDENNGTVCELFGTAQKQDPTAKLIAAAPDLLAEVKRLREALIDTQYLLTWDEKDREMDGDPVTLEALVEQVEWVRSNIMEMIE